VHAVVHAVEDSMSRRTEETIPSLEVTGLVLTVSRLSADLVRLREILAQGNWQVHGASDCCEALAFLRDESVPVLFCECDNADGNWEDLLRATARRPDPPNLIVFSRLADEYLWARVLNLGGFDVLMTPFEPEEVLRVTSAARSRWEYDFSIRAAKEAEAAGRRKPSAFRANGNLV
jgi:DNA-binding response OmpR family regulator